MMKKLPEPDITGATGLLDNAIDRKKNENYRARLQAYKAYVKNRYSDFKTNKNKLENMGVSIIIDDDDKKAIHTSFTLSFQKNIKNNALKQVYEECRGICPFCGAGKLEEVDHYIPKEHYPEFTLFPLNLIPICNKCNKRKSDKFADGNNGRMFINFYTDDMESVDFLSVDITFNSTDVKKSTRIKYVADFSKIADAYLQRIVKHHYKELNLIKRYEEAANEEISDLESTYSNQDDNNENEIIDAAERAVIGERNKRLKYIGKNDWKYLLCKKIIEVGYIKVLVNDILH